MKTLGHSAKEDERPIKPCPLCMAPNDVDAIECSKCGAIFGIPSMINPGQVITPYGPTWRRNWKLGRPRKVVVTSREAWRQLGVDLLVCIPLLILGTVMSYFAGLHRQGFWDYAGFWFGLGCVVWSVCELYWSIEMVRDAFLKEKRH